MRISINKMHDCLMQPYSYCVRAQFDGATWSADHTCTDRSAFPSLIRLISIPSYPRSLPSYKIELFFFSLSLNPVLMICSTQTCSITYENLLKLLVCLARHRCSKFIANLVNSGVRLPLHSIPMQYKLNVSDPAENSLHLNNQTNMDGNEQSLAFNEWMKEWERFRKKYLYMTYRKIKNQNKN